MSEEKQNEFPKNLFKHHPYRILKLKFICIHPNNKNYAIYLDNSSKKPVRVFKSNVDNTFSIDRKDLFVSEKECLLCAKKEILKHLMYIEEDLELL